MNTRTDELRSERTSVTFSAAAEAYDPAILPLSMTVPAVAPAALAPTSSPAWAAFPAVVAALDARLLVASAAILPPSITVPAAVPATRALVSTACEATCWGKKKGRISFKAETDISQQNTWPAFSAAWAPVSLPFEAAC
jgi:hypothetical protein